MSEQSGQIELWREIQAAWKAYCLAFGEPPHGTEKQLRAMCCLSPLNQIVRAVNSLAALKAVAEEAAKPLPRDVDGTCKRLTILHVAAAKAMEGAK